MLFNSYFFILCFLPICLIGYFTLNKTNNFKLAQAFLVAMSLWFYGYFNWNYIIIILFSVCFNYSIYIAQRKKRKKWILNIAILVNLVGLGYFKYANFFIENINFVVGTNIQIQKILLPLGISFFTFQQISFVVDAYRGEIPNYSFLEYVAFVTFFPQLVAGPIVTHEELVPQFCDLNRKKINWENVTKGIYIFVLGLSKKILLADVFGNAVNWGYANVEQLDSTNAILIMLGYTFQVYFDFSGYCDMAIGLAKMMNIDLPINFDSPYKAFTILEFWDRWHITLTRFFTKYIYIPLGGSRCGRIKTYRNVMIVFLVSGFWHGANWTFVLWGLCHGLFSVFTRIFNKLFERIHPALNWIITFGFVNGMWILFRANSIGEARQIIYKIFELNFGQINDAILQCFKPSEIKWFLSMVPIENVFANCSIGVYYAIAFLSVLGTRNSIERMKQFRGQTYKAITTAILLALCVFSFSGISSFLYFNF